MSEVHAPYHFVPLSKWVYMPDWAHLVSHDVPFKDGYCGVIEYTLTNSTPLCVGDKKDNDDVLKFARNPNNIPIIPGSSLKGMIRNVLEIASFGKFNAVDKKRFSYRDISSKSDYLTNVIGKNSVEAGWIKYNTESGKWQFIKCKYAKVAHSAILDDIGKKIENIDSPEKKYAKLPLNTSHSASISKPRGKQGNCWAENLNTGNQSGHFVFTNNRILSKGTAKDYEFSYFFYNPDKAVSFDSIEDQVSDLFANHNPEHIKHLEQNSNPELGIPVFALLTKDGKSQLHSFGLAKMPRVSYKNDTHTLIKNANPAHMDNAYFDMAELMLGTLRDKGLGLKSRITFSDAIPINNYQWDNIIYRAQPTVLASPKPTFLGAYIEQNKADIYNSYDQDSSKLSGWKRYPARKDYTTHEPSNSNKAVQNQFELLPAGHDFKGKIVFHNLKDEELAALIWCLTLDNNSYNKHSLGHAKPLGAGSVQICINETNSKLKGNIKQNSILLSSSKWCKKFVDHMNERFEPKNQWHLSPQIQHLMAITDEDIENSNDFSYLQLSDYQTIKNNKASLPPLDYKGKSLSREDKVTSKTASAAFCKGRLKDLFDENSNFHTKQQDETVSYNERVLKKLDKEKLEQEKHMLESADLSPFDRSYLQLELINNNQTNLNTTEKKHKTKELREITKILKQLTLTQQQINDVIKIYKLITFSQKDTNKAVNFFEKLL